MAPVMCDIAVCMYSVQDASGNQICQTCFYCTGGCGSMYRIFVSAAEFKGKRTIQQHRLINEVRYFLSLSNDYTRYMCI